MVRVAFCSRPARGVRVVPVVVFLGAVAVLTQAGLGRPQTGSVVGRSRQRLEVRDRRAGARRKPGRASKSIARSDRKTAFDGFDGVHYAEAELTLDASRTLGRVRRFPRSPGSGLDILEGGKRVRGRWPASVVADLIEEGAEIIVLRDYLSSGKETGPVQTSKAAVTSETPASSGASAVGNNDVDLLIPEGDWTCSEIELADVPDNAVITSVDVHYKINHAYVGDIVLELSDQTDTIQYRLRDEEGGDSTVTEKTIPGITAFAGQSARQSFLLWAADLYAGRGGYLDSWSVSVHYELETLLGDGDACLNAVPVADGVPYRGTTVGATGTYVTWCSELDTRDVWHVFTPTRTGLVTIDVVGEYGFDTTLAVFDRCGGEEIACCDDTCDSLDSEITMRMIEGTAYYLRVAGYDRGVGEYTLTVGQHTIDLPDAPSRPSPSSGAAGVASEVTLSWNGWEAVARASRTDLGRQGIDKTPGRSEKIIYGDDDRRDEHEVSDSDMLIAGDATVALVYWSDLTDNRDGTYTLAPESFAWWYEENDPIETGNPLCADEPFRDQPAPAFCSGVLVTPDLVATAGHCVTCSSVSGMAAVFGFVMTDSVTPALTVDADQVYGLTNVVAYQEGYPDWSLVRLDRQVTDHSPARVRVSGRPSVGQDLLIVGHPYGIPRKYDAGGTLRANTAEAIFEANLDAYPGSSGSPVFHGDSGQVEGLLAAGFESFEEDAANRCDRSRICPDTGCPGWEFITRSTAFGAVIPTFDIYFGTGASDLDLVSAYSPVPWYDPGPLDSGTTYYWQVVAQNAWGQVAGPVWSFTTTSSSTPDYSPIYRFWSGSLERHFYTISEAERDKLLVKYSHVWTYEGLAYNAFKEDQGAATLPVYRFWSDRLSSHFYTISERERDKLIDRYAYTWTYEGPVFYAYPEGRQPVEASPVYRFWSDTNGTHFYTMSEAERDKLINQYAHVYAYEGIAWYAYEYD